MAKAKASMTKTALHEAMANNSAGSISSRDVVDWIKLNRPEVVKSEASEILDVGLMTLAGRIAARPLDASDQGELFPLGRLKEFTDLRVSEGNGAATKRVSSLSITLDQWRAQPTKTTRFVSVHQTYGSALAAYFAEMEEMRLPGTMTLADHLKSRK